MVDNFSCLKTFNRFATQVGRMAKAFINRCTPIRSMANRVIDTLFWLCSFAFVIFIFVLFLSRPSIDENAVVNEFDHLDSLTLVMQSEFDELPYAEQVKRVTLKHYATCSEIWRFCMDNPFVPNCKVSCQDWYLQSNLSLNSKLNTSVDMMAFTQKLTKEVFDAFDPQTQLAIIDSGYFASCRDVMDYCQLHPEASGCARYCASHLNQSDDS